MCSNKYIAGSEAFVVVKCRDFPEKFHMKNAQHISTNKQRAVIFTIINGIITFWERSEFLVEFMKKLSTLEKFVMTEVI